MFSLLACHAEFILLCYSTGRLHFVLCPCKGQRCEGDARWEKLGHQRACVNRGQATASERDRMTLHAFNMKGHNCFRSEQSAAIGDARRPGGEADVAGKILAPRGNARLAIKHYR